MSIHLIQCLCPARHAIGAIFCDDAEIAPEQGVECLKVLIDLAVEKKVLRPRCEICQKDVAFHYEACISRFKTMAEAYAAGMLLEAEQMATQMRFKAMRN